MLKCYYVVINRPFPIVQEAAALARSSYSPAPHRALCAHCLAGGRDQRPRHQVRGPDQRDVRRGAPTGVQLAPLVVSGTCSLRGARTNLVLAGARGFVAYAELRSPGFSCHGVTISFNLGMLLAYPLVTGVLTVGFPFATSFLQ